MWKSPEEYGKVGQVTAKISNFQGCRHSRTDFDTLQAKTVTLQEPRISEVQCHATLRPKVAITWFMNGTKQDCGIYDVVTHVFLGHRQLSYSLRHFHIML